MAEYPINKGIGRPVEFKGLKAQYLFIFCGGLLALFVLFVILYMVFHGHIGMADYLLQPIDYLLQIASFLLLCLIEYHSNLLLKDENRVKTVRKITAIE